LEGTLLHLQTGHSLCSKKTDSRVSFWFDGNEQVSNFLIDVMQCVHRVNVVSQLLVIWLFFKWFVVFIIVVIEKAIIL